jgi:hypothetical protein
MAALGAIDVPNRTVEDFRAKLKDREAALANAKRQRDVVLNDLRLANAAVDARDQKARLRLPALNKAAAEIGRLIVSIQHEISPRAARARRKSGEGGCCETGGVPSGHG